MATPSTILAWGIAWTEEPGGLQSVGLQRVWRETQRLTLSLSPVPLGGCEEPMKVSSERARLQTAWCRVSISYWHSPKVHIQWLFQDPGWKPPLLWSLSWAPQPPDVSTPSVPTHSMSADLPWYSKKDCFVEQAFVFFHSCSYVFRRKHPYLTALMVPQSASHLLIVSAQQIFD